MLTDGWSRQYTAADGRARERPADDPHDVPHELPSHALRDARHRRGRPAPRGSGRPRQPRQPRVPVRPGPGVARDHRQSPPAAPPAGPRAPGRGRLAVRQLGRRARPRRRPDARGGPGGGRALVGARALREQLRHAGRIAPPPPLREPLGLSVVAPVDDLLGPRRLRPGADGSPRSEHEGGHGGARPPRRALGRQPRQPAEHRAAPGGGPSPRRPRGHDRRARDGGVGAVRRDDPDPARDRRRARAGDDVGADRGRSPRRGVRRAPHGRVRRFGGPRAPARARVGRAHHRGAGGPHRGSRAPVRGDASRDAPRGRELDAQGRERVAGRARDRVPAGARGPPGRARGRARPAPRSGQPRSGALGHHRARASPAGRVRPEPDAARHRRAHRPARPGPAPLRDRHAVLVRRRGAPRDRPRPLRISW